MPTAILSLLVFLGIIVNVIVVDSCPLGHYGPSDFHVVMLCGGIWKIFLTVAVHSLG